MSKFIPCTPLRWRCFFTALQNVPAKPRFFILQFMHVFNVGTEKPIHLKAIEKKLSLPAGFVSESIEYLVNNGLLRLTKNVTGEKGRPLNSFMLDTGLVEKITLPGETVEDSKLAIKSLFLESYHSKIINNLLYVDQEGARKHSLKPFNILLLISLLVNANKDGVVTRVGRSDLRKLTGMSPEQLKYQISKLFDEKYIYKLVSGFKGVRLFGLAKSVYFLDLIHPSLKAEGANNAIDVLLLREFFSLNEADEIFIQLRKLKNKRDAQFVEDIYRLVKPYFEKDYKPEAASHLQLKIQEYASYMLSWKLTQNKNQDECYKQKARKLLERRIYKDLIPRVAEYERNDNFPNEHATQAVIELIFFISERLATEIFNCLCFKEFKFNDRKKYFFLISSESHKRLELRIRSELKNS